MTMGEARQDSAPPAMLEFEVRVMRAGALLLGTSCMSGMPAATMRAMNSSGSMVRDVAFTVSMKDAAEYCEGHIAAQQRPQRAGDRVSAANSDAALLHENCRCEPVQSSVALEVGSGSGEAANGAYAPTE